jgi:integrase/recombinase XerC
VVCVVKGADLAGSSRLHVVAGAALLRPEEQLFEAMLEGWRCQQTSRYLNAVTIGQREGQVRRFQRWTNEFPWRWAAADVEEWTTAAIGERKLAHSTVSHYHVTLRLFMDFVCDARYGWAAECEDRFGTHPSQICHEWNTVAHLAEDEGRPGNRPLSREELQMLFDYADDRVGRIRASGRKGWLAAFRDAALFKVAYGWGLRRQEVAMLERCDLGRNPKAGEFGDVGAVAVRWGKASRGGPPRRRRVLTVWPWAAAVLEQYLEEVLPVYGATHDGLWPTERGGRVNGTDVDITFARLRDEVGLPKELGPHCLRHSYVTHLLEDGWDPLFVQQQVGHTWATTTAIYTGVSSDYKNQMLRQKLDKMLAGEG